VKLIGEMRFKKEVMSRAFFVLLLACFFLVSGCKRENPVDKQLQEEINRLQEENSRLKSEVEILKVQQSNPADQTSPSPTPVATSSPTLVTFEDVKGSFGEKEINQLAQLDVFETKTGKFNPQQPITRAEFVRWLVRANNTIFAGSPDKVLRLPETGKATFSDVPPTHPDFRYIQGMADAGFVIGDDQKTFKPNQILTREQMIAIKAGLDHRVAIDAYTGAPPGGWTDSDKISKKYWPALYFESLGQNNANIGRIFGTIKTFKPQAPVTKAEAAVCISAIGDNSSIFATAEEVLQKQAR